MSSKSLSRSRNSATSSSRSRLWCVRACRGGRIQCRTFGRSSMLVCSAMQCRNPQDEVQRPAVGRVQITLPQTGIEFRFWFENRQPRKDSIWPTRLRLLGPYSPCATVAAHPRAARLRRRRVRVSRRRPGTSPARIPMSHRPWKPLCIDLEYIVIPGRAQSRGPRAIQTFRVGNPPSAEEDRVFELLLEPDFESTRTPVAVGNGSRDRALAAGSPGASVCGECGTGRDREQRRESAHR